MLMNTKDVRPASLAHSGSLWLTLALSGSLSGSLWLTLALSRSLWLSQALSGSSNLLTKPLLGSQGPCLACSVATALQHFLQPWFSLSSCCMINILFQWLCSAKWLTKWELIRNTGWLSQEGWSAEFSRWNPIRKADKRDLIYGTI